MHAAFHTARSAHTARTVQHGATQRHMAIHGAIRRHVAPHGTIDTAYGDGLCRPDRANVHPKVHQTLPRKCSPRGAPNPAGEMFTPRYTKPHWGNVHPRQMQVLASMTHGATLRYTAPHSATWRHMAPHGATWRRTAPHEAFFFYQ
eukprot:gene10437-biopygen6818